MIYGKDGAMLFSEIPDGVRDDILRNGSDAAVFSMIAESLFQELQDATSFLATIAHLAEEGRTSEAAEAAIVSRQRIGDMLMKAAVLWRKRGYPWRREYGLKEH